MEHPLDTICDWSSPRNIAIEYHNSKRIKTISYSDLEGAKQNIKSVLSCTEVFQFIGINNDVKRYCIPALILGIQAGDCGFININSKEDSYVKISSNLGIRFIFSESVIPGLNLVCEVDIHGETIKLLESRTRIIISEDNSNFAYAITTSGSTGEPKIVKVPHACIVPNILDLKKILLLSRADKIAQITPLTFDPSIIEIFSSLSCGGTLFAASNDIIDNPNELLRLIFEHKVTVLQTTPSLWQYRWSDDEIRNTIFSKESNLKALIIGGEPLPKIETFRSIKHHENQTKIYNIYGITEVSCWASLREINLSQSDQLNYQNLGKTLSQTVLQVRNQNGDVIRDGEGILYIGSDSRICQIDSEISLPSKTPVFRQTGDLVTINEGNLFYKSRCDRTVKRFGSRINLTELEAAVLKLNFVKNCFALWDEKRHKLYLCISIICSQKIGDKLANDLRAQEELKKEIRRLPSFYQPDRIKYLNKFELNSSGKICRKNLMKIFENLENQCSGSGKSMSNTEEARGIFTQIWGNHLMSISDSGFIENGGTSIIAMQISNELSTALNNEFPELIGLLLKNETLINCVNYIAKKIHIPILEANDIDDSSSSSNLTQLTMNKKIKYDFQYPKTVLKPDTCVWQKCRGNSTEEIYKTDHFQGLKKGSILNLKYRKDLKKCVDASPTVFKYSNGEIYTSVGSHAGIILTQQLNDPSSKTYEINLPGRIEASILALNKFIGIVGCYDGYVYSLNLKTGEIIWKFKTGDVVKCTAVLSSDEKSIFVGSYDKFIYSISVKDGSEMWKLKESEGSISATPRTLTRYNSIVFGTLDGTCISLNQTSGQLIWKNKFKDPIFSAPGILENGDTIFCSVSGEVKCFNSETGRMIWIYKIDGNVFSHLVIRKNLNENKEDLIIGSSNKNIYYFSIESSSSTLILKYSVTFECPIFATPYCEGDVLAVAGTDGNINLLNVNTGEILNSLKLNGDIFSSPVIAEDFLIVGCRDNNMYVFKIDQ